MASASLTHVVVVLAMTPLTLELTHPSFLFTTSYYITLLELVFDKVVQIIFSIDFQRRRMSEEPEFEHDVILL